MLNLKKKINKFLGLLIWHVSEALTELATPATKRHRYTPQRTRRKRRQHCCVSVGVCLRKCICVCENVCWCKSLWGIIDIYVRIQNSAWKKQLKSFSSSFNAAPMPQTQLNKFNFFRLFSANLVFFFVILHTNKFN
mgnify:CR=1 FL=1